MNVLTYTCNVNFGCIRHTFNCVFVCDNYRNSPNLFTYTVLQDMTKRVDGITCLVIVPQFFVGKQELRYPNFDNYKRYLLSNAVAVGEPEATARTRSSPIT